MGYDDWKTADGGERLGRGNGQRETSTPGGCTGCAFRGDATATVQHKAQTGHVVTYRGTVQA